MQKILFRRRTFADKGHRSLRPDSTLKVGCLPFTNTWLNQLRQVRAAPRIIELDTDEGTADLAVATSKDPHALYVKRWNATCA